MRTAFLTALYVTLGLIVAGCGGEEEAIEPPDRWAALEPDFGANDMECVSAVLRNELEDEVILAEFESCLLGEVEAGRPVTADVRALTVEGDPIWYRYSFDGELVLVIFDNRADTFGRGTVDAQECTGLEPAGGLPRGQGCVDITMPGFPEVDS